jgi:hypothetical protein
MTMRVTLGFCRTCQINGQDSRQQEGQDSPGKTVGVKTKPPPYTPDRSATKATLLADMKDMSDIITSAQKTPMSIIENMIKLQTAQAEAMVARLAAQADGANPMYTITQMEAMKNMFTCK